MEVMVINVLNSAFETVTHVEMGIEVIDAFMHLNTRESIRRTLDKQTVHISKIFMEDLNTVKRELTAKSAVLGRMHPQYAGAALWAKGLKRRIEKYLTKKKNKNKNKNIF
jgi:dynein heavy chain